MTDREMLEFAAKAAGMKCRWWKVKEWAPTSYASGAMRGRMFKGNKDVFGTHHSKPWNPPDDDGDALRLAVKLSLHVRMWVYACEIETNEGVKFGLNHCGDFGGDISKATRYAITRAAAEIGKRMP